MNDGSEMVLRGPIKALRPSEYTSALIQALRDEPDRVRGRNVLEIGSGSGVVLAVLGSLGAASVCGIDIEQEAIEAGINLLADLGHDNAEFHLGDMWLPVAGRRFDLIVANLPNSPHPQVPISGRPPNWSAGGYDGRLLVDAFIAALRTHLVPGGRALMTHNSYIGLDQSREAAHANGLSFDVRLSILVYVPEEKLALMTPSIVQAAKGQSLHSFGPYTFGEIHIVELGAPA
ncbi:MAG: methyltransferase domain-containing protein [Reyranella sp.]|uniref:methyltransferase domain-containing protein n=1 Tax=Reyranella sp. TaxID=1929291 RepID=UPI001AC38FBB|nr:methyltransferase domain-containing protein [Reyranella sp.]MBN9086151.1 methyltransferase domain-containing protein [Reyranella sp.]